MSQKPVTTQTPEKGFQKTSKMYVFPQGEVTYYSHNHKSDVSSGADPAIPQKMNLNIKAKEDDNDKEKGVNRLLPPTSLAPTAEFIFNPKGNSALSRESTIPPNPMTEDTSWHKYLTPLTKKLFSDSMKILFPVDVKDIEKFLVFFLKDILDIDNDFITFDKFIERINNFSDRFFFIDNYTIQNYSDIFFLKKYIKYREDLIDSAEENFYSSLNNNENTDLSVLDEKNMLEEYINEHFHDHHNKIY